MKSFWRTERYWFSGAFIMKRDLSLICQMINISVTDRCHVDRPFWYVYWCSQHWVLKIWMAHCHHCPITWFDHDIHARSTRHRESLCTVNVCCSHVVFLQITRMEKRSGVRFVFLAWSAKSFLPMLLGQEWSFFFLSEGRVMWHPRCSVLGFWDCCFNTSLEFLYSTVGSYSN